VVGDARARFYGVVGAPELARLFPQPLYFEADKAELFPLIDRALSSRTTAEWCRLLDEAEIRHSPVSTIAEVVADSAAWDNGYLSRVGEPGKETAVVCPPVLFSDTPAQASAAAPELGQHTEQVLLEAGYSWDDIVRLSEEGAI
jgi:crotonobetainyl-CoA:carnitine CoA-transferase CaiB-like acyl-CoA transferase